MKKPKKGSLPAVEVGIPSPISDEVQGGRDLTQERDNEVIPVAKEILKAIANREDVPMGARTEAQGLEVAKFFQKVYVEDIAPILMKHNVRMVDITYIFQLVMQPISFVKDMTQASLQMNEEIATAALWGVPEIEDVRIMDLDAQLKKDDGRGDNASEKTEDKVS